MTAETSGSARLSVFTPLNQGGRADVVARRITEAIRLGLVAEGEQLPSEADLAAQFGVSTVTLREALASLREQGYVTTRRGRNGGSFVRRPSGQPIDRLEAALANLSGTELRDLGDEAAAVSAACARLAARRAEHATVSHMFELARMLAETEPPGECARLDSRFHIEVAVGSQSERLTHREVSLQSEYASLLWLPAPEPLDPAVAAREHLAIASAIENEDESLAYSLSREHATASMRRLLRAHIGLSR